MAGETNIQIVKAANASTVSRAPTTAPEKDVVRTAQGQSVPSKQDLERAEAKNRAEEQAKQRQFDEADIAEFVSEIESSVQNVQRDLRFAVDKHSGDTIIKVIDSSTDEVIRQIPSEEFMALRERIQSFRQGSLIDDEA